MSLDCLTAGAEQEILKESFFHFVFVHFFIIISEEQKELVMSLGGGRGFWIGQPGKLARNGRKSKLTLD